MVLDWRRLRRLEYILKVVGWFGLSASPLMKSVTRSYGMWHTCWTGYGELDNLRYCHFTFKDENFPGGGLCTTGSASLSKSSISTASFSSYFSFLFFLSHSFKSYSSILNQKFEISLLRSRYVLPSPKLCFQKKAPCEMELRHFKTRCSSLLCNIMPCM